MFWRYIHWISWSLVNRRILIAFHTFQGLKHVDPNTITSFLNHGHLWRSWSSLSSTLLGSLSIRCWETAAGNCSHFKTSINDVWHTAFCILYSRELCIFLNFIYWPNEIDVSSELISNAWFLSHVEIIEESFSASSLWGFKWLDESINRTAIWIVDLLPELLHLPYMGNGRSHWWTDLLQYRCFDSTLWPCTR